MKKLILIAFVCATALYSSAQGYFGIKPIVNEPTCYGASTGSIQLSLVGGTGPFNYAWSGSLPSTNSQSNLPAGSYAVTVTDANNLTSSYTVIVGQPYEFSVTSSSNVGVHGQNNGYVELSVDGGTPNYTYLWSDGETTADIYNLPSGHYICTITDAAGCTTQVGYDVAHPVFHGQATNGGNDPRDLSTSGNAGASKATTGMGSKGSELKSSDIKLYPNPASNNFTLLTGDVKSAQISVIDINGQIVSQQKTESNETNLNVSNLPNGNYVIEIRSEDGSVVNKTVTVAK